jgi:hypothetical protein
MDAKNRPPAVPKRLLSLTALDESRETGVESEQLLKLQAVIKTRRLL